jgi:hypothetical protein
MFCADKFCIRQQVLPCPRIAHGVGASLSARPVRIIVGQTAGGATPFFGGLSDASLDLLPSMLVERRFDVGATVLAEGEPGRAMFIVRRTRGEQARGFGARDSHGGSQAWRFLRFFRRNDAHRNAEPISLRRRGDPNRAVRAHGPVLQGRHPPVCDGDAEYQPRTLCGSATPTIALPSWQILHGIQRRRFACVMSVEKKLRRAKWDAMV